MGVRKPVSFSDTESKSPEFTHWASGQPRSGVSYDCAAMKVDEGYYLNGFWEAVNCANVNYYAICQAFE